MLKLSILITFVYTLLSFFSCVCNEICVLLFLFYLAIFSVLFSHCSISCVLSFWWNFLSFFLFYHFSLKSCISAGSVWYFIDILAFSFQSSFSDEIHLMKNVECSSVFIFVLISLTLKTPYVLPCLDLALSSYNFQIYLCVNMDEHPAIDLQKCIIPSTSFFESLMSVQHTLYCVWTIYASLNAVVC